MRRFKRDKRKGLARGGERRPEVRPEVRNCPGRGAGRGKPRREGPPAAAGRWQGQLPSTGKAAPEPNTPVSANSRPCGLFPSSRSPGARSSNPEALPTFGSETLARGRARLPGLDVQS